jgi:hypothetical protein
MRWLAVVVLVIAGTADARIKVQVISPGDVCSSGPTWDAVVKCLRLRGKVTIERELPKARLVRVVEHDGESSYDHGLYLYVQRDDRAWAFVSAVPAQHVTVLGFAPHTIARQRGYRLSLGELDRRHISLDGETTISVTLAEQHSVFCSGAGNDCATATTHCDVIYRGKTLWTFRGRLVFEDGLVRDVGDRSHGGQMCMPQERVFLEWPSK